MKRILSQLFPVVFGLLVVGAGSYVGWIFYQAGQGDLVEVEIKQVEVELNLRQSLVDALLDVVLNQEFDLELDPEVRAEVELDNPSIFAVRIHDIDGELTVEGMELDYEITGLEPDQVGVKATTNEKLGAEGREEGISSQAVALLCKP